MAAILRTECAFSPTEEARGYNGRRFALRQLAERSLEKEVILAAHTALMAGENRTVLKGFLWKAEKNGKVVHLVGTGHGRIYIRGADYPSTPSSCAMSDLLAWNAVRDEYAQGIIHPLIKGVCTAAQCLYVEVNMFDPDYNMQIWEVLEKSGGAESIACTPTSFTSSSQTLNASIAQTAAKAERVYGLDGALLTFARSNRKEIRNLESVAIQVNSLQVIHRVQREEPTHFMFCNEARLEEMDAAQWGNLETMTEITQALPQEVQTDYAARNQAMSTQIVSKLAAGEKAVFAVGASHFIGNTGIVALLEKEGITLTRLSLDLA